MRRLSGQERGERRVRRQSPAGLLKYAHNWSMVSAAAPTPVLHSEGLHGSLSIGFPRLIVASHLPEEEMRQGSELHGGGDMTWFSGGSCGIWIEPSCPVSSGCDILQFLMRWVGFF